MSMIWMAINNHHLVSGVTPIADVVDLIALISVALYHLGDLLFCRVWDPWVRAPRRLEKTSMSSDDGGATEMDFFDQEGIREPKNCALIIAPKDPV